MSERQNKTVVVFESYESWRDDWMPGALQDAIAWLQEKLASIPEEHQDSAGIEIRGGGGYDGEFPIISITYDRPETDAEMADRLEVQRQRAMAEEERLLRLLQRVRETGRA
jgi:hypothetical protein